MSLITIKGMRFYAYHGFYEEEQILGTDYVVDVYINTDITQAAIEDDLQKTINYETVYLICQAEMRKKKKLLETVATAISLSLRHQFKYIYQLKVTIKKLHPPMGGRVESAWVESEGDYSKNCIRCGRPMLCYNDQTCWCMDTIVFRKTLEQLRTHYGNNCLCRDCLEYFAGAEQRPLLKE